MLDFLMSLPFFLALLMFPIGIVVIFAQAVKGYREKKAEEAVLPKKKRHITIAEGQYQYGAYVEREKWKLRMAIVVLFALLIIVFMWVYISNNIQ